MKWHDIETADSGQLDDIGCRNYQIGGGAANQSASYFDGVPINTGFGNIVALVPSQDAVSEFRVETGCADCGGTC